MLSISPLDPEHAERALPLLVDYPYKPYRAYAGDFGEEAISRLFLAGMQPRLSASDPPPLWALDGEIPVGLLLWSHLVSDSRRLGIASARIDLLAASGAYPAQRVAKSALIAEVLSHAGAAGVEHLSARVDARDFAGIHALETHGFITVDGLIAYGRRLQPGSWISAPPDGFTVRRAAPCDIPAIIALAGSVFIYSRLHADPAIPRAAADAIHAAWLEDSCAPGSADAVWLAEDGEGVLGYSVARLDNGTIPYFRQPFGIWVIAATAARARGRGVARSLCFAMFDWHYAQGARVVQGGTQLANVASARLHESCGFHVASTGLSLTRSLKGTP